MMAIFTHRHLQRPQMGWTLVERGWTLSNTSRVTCLGPKGPQKMAPGGPRGPKNGHILPMMAIFAHRHIQRDLFGPSGLPKNGTGRPQGPKNGHILPMMV